MKAAVLFDELNIFFYYSSDDNINMFLKKIIQKIVTNSLKLLSGNNSAII